MQFHKYFHLNGKLDGSNMLFAIPNNILIDGLKALRDGRSKICRNGLEQHLDVDYTIKKGGIIETEEAPLDSDDLTIAFFLPEAFDKLIEDLENSLILPTLIDKEK